MILIKISEWATFYLFNQLQKISPRIYFLSKSISSCDQIYIYIYKSFENIKIPIGNNNITKFEMLHQLKPSEI